MSNETGSRAGDRRRRDRRAGWAAIGGGAAVLAYWTLFFTGLLDAAAPGTVAREFELAFPAADALFAACAIAAGAGLLRGADRAFLLLVAAGAMSLYLGCLDVTFYARQGLYRPLLGSGGLELLLNLVCVLGGGYALRFGWAYALDAGGRTFRKRAPMPLSIVRPRAPTRGMKAG